MTTILVTIGIATVVLLLVVGGMAVGVLFGRRPISGSCGGLGGQKDADGKISCSVCSKPAEGCEELRSRMEANEPTGAEK